MFEPIELATEVESAVNQLANVSDGQVRGFQKRSDGRVEIELVVAGEDKDAQAAEQTGSTENASAKGEGETEQSEQQKSAGSSSDELVCEKCGATDFDSHQELGGHKRHCDGSSSDEAENQQNSSPSKDRHDNASDCTRISREQAEEALSGVDWSLDHAMQKSGSSYQGKVANGVNDRNDRKKLYLYRFGECPADGCQEGIVKPYHDFCSEHRDDSESAGSSSDEPENQQNSSGDDGGLTKAELVEKLMDDGLSPKKATERAESVFQG